MKKDYAEIADTLIAALGGKENITRLFHCMTRLRFYVKDRTKINEKEILKVSGISGVNWHEDQFQVIAGNEVNEMYKALENKETAVEETNGREAAIEIISQAIESYIENFCR